MHLPLRIITTVKSKSFGKFGPIIKPIPPVVIYTTLTNVNNLIEVDIKRELLWVLRNN